MELFSCLIQHQTLKLKRKSREFGGEFITIKLIGDSYDDCYEQAIGYCKNKNNTFIHPFDDE